MIDFMTSRFHNNESTMEKERNVPVCLHQSRLHMLYMNVCVRKIIDGKTHLKVEFTPKSKTRIFLLPRVLFLHHVGATTRG